MERRGPGRVPGPGPHRSRRASVRRIVTLLAVAVASGFLLVACGGEVHPYSHVSPETENGRDIQGLYKVLFWMALIVFIGVQAALVYTALKYRRRAEIGRASCRERG